MDINQLLKLENQLCFTVYACSREIIRMYRPMLDKLGITYPQYLVLLVLWETDELTVSQLGERLYLDSGTLTPLLKRMESMGLITRRRSETDERKVYIYLTEQGQELKTRAVEIPKTLMKCGIQSDRFRVLLHEFRDLLHHVSETTRDICE